MEMKYAVEKAIGETLYGESVPILAGRPGDGKITYLQDFLYAKKIKYAYLNMQKFLKSEDGCILDLELKMVYPKGRQDIDGKLAPEFIPSIIKNAKSYAGKDGIIIIDEVSEHDNILDIIKNFYGYRIMLVGNGSFRIKGASDVNITISHILELEYAE